MQAPSDSLSLAKLLLVVEFQTRTFLSVRYWELQECRVRQAQRSILTRRCPNKRQIRFRLMPLGIIRSTRLRGFTGSKFRQHLLRRTRRLFSRRLSVVVEEALGIPLPS